MTNDDSSNSTSSPLDHETADCSLYFFRMLPSRVPNSRRLNLEEVGVALGERGDVKVDEYSCTNVSSIWAIGDVTNRMNLTHVALMEGTCFAKTAFGGQPSKPDYSNTPCAVFSIPPLFVVGLSEEQVVAQANSDTVIYTSTFNPMKNTISGPIQGGVSSKDLFDDYIRLWVQEMEFSLLELCKAEKVLFLNNDRIAKKFMPP